MNAWRETLPRVVGHLVSALLAQDFVAVKRELWRLAARVGLHRPTGPYADVRTCALAFATTLVACLFWGLLVALILSGGIPQ